MPISYQERDAGFIDYKPYLICDKPKFYVRVPVILLKIVVFPEFGLPDKAIVKVFSFMAAVTDLRSSGL